VKFLRTELLFLIWVVPLLALAFWYGGRKRRQVLERFAHSRSLAALVPAATPGRRSARAAFILAGVLLLVPALAGPQYGFHWQQIEREGVDIVIALDCSRSMLSQDIAPTRLDRAKREIIDLLHMLEGDRVALVAFSGTAFLQCPLTLDYQSFDLFLNVLAPDYLPVGGTNLSAALDTAVSAFDPQSAADKAVILITDGENTSRRDPMEAARAAQETGVKLYCIGVGAREGVPIPAAKGGFEKDAKGQIVLSRLDETTLSRMALATGGTYVRSVAGDMDLEAIYRQRIAVDLQAATVESGRKQVWADRFQWPLALAVALLFIGLWLPLTPNKIARGTVVVLAAGLALAPGPAQAGHLQEGYKAYQKGEYEQALKEFIQGQLDSPDNPEVLYNLGNAYYQNGDYRAAREHYLQALNRLPADAENNSDLSALKAKLHYNLGNTDYRLRELQAAVQDYEKALNYQPDDDQARENLAFVKKQMQQQQQQQGGQNQSEADAGQQDGEHSGQSAGDQSAGQQADQSQGAQPQGSQNNAAPPPQYGDQTAADRGSGGDEEQKSAQSAGARAPADQEPRGAVPAPGVQMLNRLKDEPGRAMMPHYQKRQVEKDY